MTNLAQSPGVQPLRPGQPGNELDETVFRSVAKGLSVPVGSESARPLALAVAELLNTMVSGLGENWIGGPWDPRKDIGKHTSGYLDERRDDYREMLAKTLSVWAGQLDAEGQIRMLLHLWWECFGLWDRSLAYRTIKAVADAVADVAGAAAWDGWPRWQRDTWCAVGTALRLMQMDGRVFAQMNLSAADRLQCILRDEIIDQVGKIRDDLGGAWARLGEQPSIEQQIRPCVSYIWVYARQTAMFYDVIREMSGALMAFERWLTNAGRADGGRRPGAASPALWPLSLRGAPRVQVVQSLESLQKIKDQLSSHTLSEIEPWEQMLIGLRDLMTAAPAGHAAPRVLIPRQVWVRYCFPFAVQDDDGERVERLLQTLSEADPDEPRPEGLRHPLSRRLQEVLDAKVGPGLMRVAEAADLAQTEFFQVGTSEDGHFGGIRINLPDLMFVTDFLDGIGPRPYRAWLDLNWMGNFCLSIEAAEPLKEIPPPRLYRALRAGTPFVFGEPITLAPPDASEDAGGVVGQPPQWDSLHMFARGMVRAVTDAYYSALQKDRRSMETPYYVRANLHEVVVVQTDAPIALQAEAIARQLDSAVGGRILLRSLQRGAATLEEWTRFPPLQRTEQRASSVVAVPEIGYAADWFVHTGETTVFGIVAVPAWFRDVYLEAAQFASSWSPVLQLWNRRLQVAINNLRKKHDADPGAAAEELRNVEQQVRRHLSQINAEDLCATLAYRRFLDGLLDAVGIGRLEKELEAQLQAAEQLTDYFYQRAEERAGRRRDVLLFFIALLGVFGIADFLALLDTTQFRGRIGFIRLSTAGQWQDMLVLILFGLALVGGVFVWLRIPRPGSWARRKRGTRDLRSSGRGRLHYPTHDREARHPRRPSRHGFLPGRSRTELQCQ
jgi:hypothetical protein